MAQFGVLSEGDVQALKAKANTKGRQFDYTPYVDALNAAKASTGWLSISKGDSEKFQTIRRRFQKASTLAGVKGLRFWKQEAVQIIDTPPTKRPRKNGNVTTVPSTTPAITGTVVFKASGLGKKVARARLSANMTCEELAKKAGMDATDLYNSERGNRPFTGEEVGKIANVLNMPAETLTGKTA